MSAREQGQGTSCHLQVPESGWAGQTAGHPQEGQGLFRLPRIGAVLDNNLCAMPHPPLPD